MNRLHRSSQNKMIAGVCGGLGEYFNVDPTVIRFIWAILSLISIGFPGILIYVVAALIFPEG